MTEPFPEVFTLRLPQELRRELDVQAALEHRSTAALIRVILAEWLRRQDKRRLALEKRS